MTQYLFEICDPLLVRWSCSACEGVPLYCLFVQPQTRQTKAYYDGGGGTPPSTKLVTESLNAALQQTIKYFELQRIAEPFCQCYVNAARLHKYR